MEGRLEYPYHPLYPTIPETAPSLQPELRINTIDEADQEKTRAFEEAIEKTRELLIKSGELSDQEQNDIVNELIKYVRGQTNINTVKYAISKGKDENKKDMPPDCLPSISLLDDTHLQELKSFLEQRTQKTGFFSPHNFFVNNGIKNSLLITLAASVSPYILIPAAVFEVGSQFFHQREVKQRANEILNDFFRLDIQKKNDGFLQCIATKIPLAATSTPAVSQMGLWGAQAPSAPFVEEQGPLLSENIQPKQM